MYDIIIIGGGVAGFSAAMYTGRFNMKTLLIGENFGGTVLSAHKIENYPGINSIQGPELARNIEEHAKKYKIEVKESRVVEIKKGKGAFKVLTETKKFETKTLLIATGSEKKKSTIKGAKEFNNKGVHYCAVCDGPVYSGKDVAVVGGNDSAAKSALFLAQYAKKVYLIYRKENIRAEPIYTRQITKDKKIQIINNTNITEIKGGKFVNSVVLDNGKELPVEAVFFEIGHIPSSGLFGKLGIKINKNGEIIIDKFACTNIPGIFAAGDVTDIDFKQVVTAAGFAVLGAYSAFRYIKGT